MMQLLGDTVEANSFLLVFVIILIIGYFCYKEWPEFQRRVAGSKVDDAKTQNSEEKFRSEIAEMKSDICDIKKTCQDMQQKLQRDYEHIGDLERDTRRQQMLINGSLEERRILMQGMIACLDGLEQLKCNHTVPATKKMISEYLNEQAHKNKLP